MSFGEKVGAEVKSKAKKSLLNLQQYLEWPVLMALWSAIILGKKNIPGCFCDDTSCQFFHKCRNVMSFYPHYTGFFSNVEEILLVGVHVTWEFAQMLMRFSVYPSILVIVFTVELWSWIVWIIVSQVFRTFWHFQVDCQCLIFAIFIPDIFLNRRFL